MTGIKEAELDPAGEETLEVIASAHKFNKWMFDTILPYCKGTILEVGSGIGNISAYFLANKFPTWLSDLRSNYCNSLQQQFKGNPYLQGIVKLNLVLPDFETEYSEMLGKFDTIVALNVVEHIEQDSLAITNCRKLLAPSGHLVILVPAYQFLYNRFDKELEHFRRYTKQKLHRLLTEEGLTVIHQQYFNLAGIAGWIYSGAILKKKTIPGGQMKLYNKLVPLFRIIDSISFNQMGLSVIAIGKKN